MESPCYIEQGRDGADAAHASYSETLRSFPTIRSRPEHRGRHAVCHDTYVGVSRGYATRCRGLLRRGSLDSPETAQLRQPRRRCLCPGYTAPLPDTQTCGSFAAQEMNEL